MFKLFERTRFALVAALVVGVSSVAMAGGAPLGGADVPLSLQQASQLPNFQPLRTNAVPDVGSHQARGLSRAGWHYSVEFERTSDGWRLVDYQATRSEAQLKEQRSFHTWNLARDGVGDGWSSSRVTGAELADNLAFIVLPPPDTGPGEPQDPPDDPDRTHFDDAVSCGIGDRAFDLSVNYEWVPGHYEENDDGDEYWVEGHWEMVEYHASFDLDACPSGP